MYFKISKSTFNPKNKLFLALLDDYKKFCSNEEVYETIMNIVSFGFMIMAELVLE